VHCCRYLDVAKSMNKWDAVHCRRLTGQRPVLPFLFPLAVRFRVRRINSYRENIPDDVLSFIFWTSCMIDHDDRKLNGIAPPPPPGSNAGRTHRGRHDINL
jgi:hypothetical protein